LTNPSAESITTNAKPMIKIPMITLVIMSFTAVR
jgi:hypothetical protein